MKILVAFGIHEDTRSKTNWLSAGASWVLPHNYHAGGVLQATMAEGADIILNLGVKDMPDLAHVWGTEALHYVHRTPFNTRKAMHDLLPAPYPREYPEDIWVKNPGYGGQGKFKVKVRGHIKFLEKVTALARSGHDTQCHIKGSEFRIITVGNTIVGASRRSGSNSARRYSTVENLGELSAEISHIVGRGTHGLPTRSVTGWDTILEDGTGTAYILEGNSQPGVNVESAAAILNAIKEQHAIS